MIATDPFGIDYPNDDGCTMHIAELTLNYTNICFGCTAMNALGTNTLLYNSIDFSSKVIFYVNLKAMSIFVSFSTECSPNQEIFIYANGTQQIEGNTTLIVYHGDSLQLSCDVHGVTNDFFLSAWLMNSTDINNFTYYDNYTYDEASCLGTGIKYFRNLAYNDSGTYTCVYGSGKNGYILVTFRLNVSNANS